MEDHRRRQAPMSDYVFLLSSNWLSAQVSPRASSYACEKVWGNLQANCTSAVSSLFLRGHYQLIGDRRSPNNSVRWSLSFPHWCAQSLWHGLLILVSPFHIRKASSVGVISFYGSQELPNYIFHEAFATVISYSCVVGFPRKPVFLGWLCYIHILTEANLERIHKKPRKIPDISVKWILRTSTIKINERQDNGGTVKLR